MSYYVEIWVGVWNSVATQKKNKTVVATPKKTKPLKRERFEQQAR